MAVFSVLIDESALAESERDYSPLLMLLRNGMKGHQISYRCWLVSDDRNAAEICRDLRRFAYKDDAVVVFPLAASGWAASLYGKDSEVWMLKHGMGKAGLLSDDPP